MKKTLEKIGEVLGWFLSQQTGYVPPSPMDFLTVHGNRIGTESRYVMAALAPDALPEDVLSTSDNERVAALTKAWTTGVELGKAVVVCYDTGLGFTAVRATVVKREEGKEPREG